VNAKPPLAISDNWSRFTAASKLALSRSIKITKEFKLQLLTPEAVLLGLIETKGDEVATLLISLDINLEQARLELKSYLASLSSTEDNNLDASPKLSEEAKTMLEQAVEAAREIGLDYIGATHLLLGILRMPSLTATQILEQQGISIYTIGSHPTVMGTDDAKASVYPSPIFVLILGITILAGYIAYQGNIENGLPVFVFVTGGWIVSLALHEFAHAFTAYHSGDKSVVQKGYLSLNPLKYVHGMWSIVLPTLFLIVGGLGLPGAAVSINRTRIKSRLKQSLVSAAGPLATGLFILFISIPFILRVSSATMFEHRQFWAGLTFLIFIEVNVLLLCLLPIPSMDGFNALEPFLPEKSRQVLLPASRYSFFIILILFFYDNPVRGWFQSVVGFIADLVGLDQFLIYTGYNLFRFWGG
jgi:Zn-dependent protease